jgi:hypothetical protein
MVPADAAAFTGETGTGVVPAQTTEESMPRLTRITAALCLAGASVVGGGAPSANALAGEDYFVVDTQFRQAPSSIVDAGGAFAGCTSVNDLWGEAIPLSPQRLLFRGEKRISCAGGKVIISYEATTATGLVTIGSWSIVSSTLTGATSGGGSLHGDSKTCTIDRNSGGCILDTFSGYVS